jgi:hypothetical protein
MWGRERCVTRLRTPSTTPSNALCGARQPSRWHVPPAAPPSPHAQVVAGVRALDLKAFRHTYATALIEGGEVDSQIARLMGHADTTVTRRVYAHAFARPEGSVAADGFAAAIFQSADVVSKV